MVLQSSERVFLPVRGRVRVGGGTECLVAIQGFFWLPTFVYILGKCGHFQGIAELSF